jgi:hypothetical protein
MLKKIWNKVKEFFRKLLDIIKMPYVKIKRELEYRKRLKELKKRDPFIYK